MWPLVKKILMALAYSQAYRAVSGGALAKKGLKRLFGGALLIFIGSQVGLVGIVLLAISIFFKIADLDQYVWASLWTSFFVLLTALLLLIQGGIIVRRR